jgi:hypothetical protein
MTEEELDCGESAWHPSRPRFACIYDPTVVHDGFEARTCALSLLSKSKLEKPR